jgi:hypothetical protein
MNSVGFFGLNLDYQFLRGLLELLWFIKMQYRLCPIIYCLQLHKELSLARELKISSSPSLNT